MFTAWRNPQTHPFPLPLRFVVCIFLVFSLVMASYIMHINSSYLWCSDVCFMLRKNILAVVLSAPFSFPLISLRKWILRNCKSQHGQRFVCWKTRIYLCWKNKVSSSIEKALTLASFSVSQDFAIKIKFQSFFRYTSCLRFTRRAGKFHSFVGSLCVHI